MCNRVISKSCVLFWENYFIDPFSRKLHFPYHVSPPYHVICLYVRLNSFRPRELVNDKTQTRSKTSSTYILHNYSVIFSFGGRKLTK